MDCDGRAVANFKIISTRTKRFYVGNSLHTFRTHAHVLFCIVLISMCYSFVLQHILSCNLCKSVYLSVLRLVLAHVLASAILSVPFHQKLFFGGTNQLRSAACQIVLLRHSWCSALLFKIAIYLFVPLSLPFCHDTTGENLRSADTYFAFCVNQQCDVNYWMATLLCMCRLLLLYCKLRLPG